MKAVILAGGFGTRISEESHLKPKPMIEIGNRPILWHIMKIYSHFGINDFIICLGYKGYLIKEYFANYYLHSSDICFNLETGSNTIINKRKSEPWKVTLVETGENTQTGGRLKRIKDFVENETFCFTYGDGVADINISELIKFHTENRAKSTLLAVQPPGRYGALEIKKRNVASFQEKPIGDGSWVNGGFFVLEPDVFELIDGDNSSWEARPLEKLARNGELFAYQHKGFWQSMDTLRDKLYLEQLWNSGKAPWKLWT